jgi:nucleoside-diphosphate-sugar epimerase
MILVTGVPGWLGNRLLETLVGVIPAVNDTPLPDKKEIIRCLCLKGTNSAFLKVLAANHRNIEIVKGNISSKKTLEQFFRESEGAILYHLAGVIHPVRGIREFYSVNVVGTHNILSLAQRHKLRKVIFVSSNSPCGTNPSNTHRFTEQSPYNPYMHYGRSKMLAEKIIQDFSKKRCFKTTIIRACWFYGPHQPERQTHFFQLVKEGLFPLVGPGKNRRSLSYIDDICQALLLSAHNTASDGKTYWIADKEPYTMNEIIHAVGEVLRDDFGMGVKPPRLKLPNIAGSFAMAADALLQSVGLYNQRIHVLGELNKTIACSINLAKQELGFRPSGSLLENMRKSIAWCLEHGQKI